MTNDSLRNDKTIWGENPFAAPETEVEEARDEIEEGALLSKPNSVATGRGIEWIREGWRLMQGSMGVWIGMVFAWSLIMVIFVKTMPLMSFVGALIELLALVLLPPVFIAGLMLACHEKARGEDIHFGYLFAGFSNRMSTLMMLGLVSFLVSLPVSIVISVGFGLLVAASVTRGPGALSPMLPILLFSPFIIPLLIVMWLSPQLVALHEELTAWKAFKLAVRGMLRNILPFAVNGIAFLGLAMLAVIPLGLGLLLLIPLGVCTFYAAYRDIFIAPR
ncbi:MAG: hypothetical protein LBC37_04265 [Zoogloeaceae bacterium]|jgi:hypothetical protein|nr:hypothetical protein [Zoogloeaceae bacterium]